MPTGIGAYPDAGPLSGYVPSRRIDFAVTPGVAVGRAPAVAPTTAVTASAATISRNVFLMRSLLLRSGLGGASVRTIRVLDPKEKDPPCGAGTPAAPRARGRARPPLRAPRRARAAAPRRTPRARI